MTEADVWADGRMRIVRQTECKTAGVARRTAGKWAAIAGCEWNDAGRLSGGK